MTTKQQLIQRIRHGAHGARWCLGMIVTITAAACAPAPEPTHQTVDYYRANREAREAKVAECANDPGSLGKTPDCTNAKQAAAIEDIGNLRDLPPMGLLKDADEKSDHSSSSSSSSRGGGTNSQPREDR